MSKEILETVTNLFPEVDLTMVSQGAEALVFTASSYVNYKGDKVTTGETCVLKYRPTKRYRHPVLDKTITKQRTRKEAKVMEKMHKSGFQVPKLLYVDQAKGSIWMSYVGYTLANGDQSSLKNWLWEQEHLASYDSAAVRDVLIAVGEFIGKMHLEGVVHGDLTTSNIVVMEDRTVAVIDFGLASQRVLVEDKAVDLYVLERALVSTHSKHAERYGEWVIEGYNSAHSTEVKEWVAIERRLQEVRQRGRKRSMLG